MERNPSISKELRLSLRDAPNSGSSGVVSCQRSCIMRWIMPRKTREMEATLRPVIARLAFAGRTEAEAARERLSRRLPGSDQAWVITEDVGRVEDTVER